MKFAIFGDIHANLEALNAVLEDAKNHDCTHYVCIGDIVGYNANPRECLNIIRSLDCPVVKGNHDEVASSDSELVGLNPLAQHSMQWTRDNLDSEDKVTRSDFAASYQEAIIDSLLSNFVKAVEDTGVKSISGGGGVMANSRLREKMNIFAEKKDLNIYLPTPKLSTDNAAMICVAAQNNLITNDINTDDVRLSSIIV